MSDRQTKIAKARDLMKLAEGNSNEAERKSALEAADKIIKKYGIEPWELNPKPVPAGAVMWASMGTMSMTLADLIQLVTAYVSADIINEEEGKDGHSTSKKK